MSEGGRIKVLVVDDHEIVRRGVIDLITAHDDLEVVAEAATVKDAVRRAAAVRPDIAVVDLKLPDGNGIAVVRALRAEHPAVRCIVLTSFDEDSALAAAVEAGVSAFILKSVRGTEIIEAIRSVAQGRNLLDERSVARRQASQPDPSQVLTRTEHVVIDLIGQGHSNREIGEKMGLAEKTVKNHVTSILAKMGFQRRTQAAAWVASRRNNGSWDRP